MTSRRQFLKNSAAIGAAAVASSFISRSAYAAGSDEIRVGVIGCGGRGSDAAMNNVLVAAENVKIVSLGDVFKEPIDRLRRALTAKYGKDKVDIPDDRVHVGLDAYEKVINDDVNYVILASPPGFRPLHLEAAVKAGRHIFTEKPVCVDGPGYRRCIKAYEEAKAKKLGIVAGTQRRHQAGYLDTIRRIHDGAIGEIVSARCYWNGGDIWFKERLPGMTDVAYHCYNWYHFLWTCGDHIVEQHIHNIDVINWAMQAVPVRASGMGGRSRRDPSDPRERPDPRVAGQIFDHFAVEFTYGNGVVLHSYCRQITGCDGNISEALVGTKGRAQVNDYQINGKRVFQGREQNPYIQEHTDLIESIRRGEPLNELKTVSDSSLTAIMGRMATYTGREVTWEEAANSEEDTYPKNLTWDMSLDVAPAPIPGSGQRRRPRRS